MDTNDSDTANEIMDLTRAFAQCIEKREYTWGIVLVACVNLIRFILSNIVEEDNRSKVADAIVVLISSEDD